MKSDYFFKMSSFNLESEFKKFVSQFENYEDFENLIVIMDKFVSRFKISEDTAKFHENVISEEHVDNSIEQSNSVNFFHSIKLKYKANSSGSYHFFARNYK